MKEDAINTFNSPFGYTHPERDKREMCPYCYNEETTRIVGTELNPFTDFHKGTPFRAFECSACNAKFHFTTTENNHGQK